MDDITRYRSFAARCLKMASSTADPIKADMLRKLGGDHERMAQELEQRLRRR
jgi:hypothetical protein